MILKNLHLVTGWLGSLEAELSSEQMEKPHESFRLWLTSEPHPKFPLVLLRSCLKITYEPPPGVKKNMLRTFEAWSPEYLSKGAPVRAQLLFVLAWFHAVVAERRTYIPQGWVKFYEFSFADLRSAADIVEEACKSGVPNYAAIHGLLESAVYGGHVDSSEDIRVLSTYLRQFFHPDTLTGKRRLHGKITVPSAPRHAEFVGAAMSLPDEDVPALFGLPLNADRAVQSTTSAIISSQLKSLNFSASVATVFNRDAWNAALTPIINLWDKAIKSAAQLLEPSPQPAPDLSPLANFVAIESLFGRNIVRLVEADLRHISRVIAGTALLTSSTSAVAKELLTGSVPSRWSDQWEGPENLSSWLVALVRKAWAVESSWVKAKDNLLRSPQRLADLFNPAVFLNALRQHTARSTKAAMDSLKLCAAWGSSASSVSSATAATVTGLMVAGAGFLNGKLTDVSSSDSPLIPMEDAVLAWIPKEKSEPYPENSV